MHNASVRGALGALVGAALLAGCLEVSEPSQRSYGSIVLTSTGTTGSATLTPYAYFFRNTTNVSIPDSRALQGVDRCGAQALPPNPDEVTVASGGLSAGDAIIMSLSGATVTLPQQVVGTQLRYEPATVTQVPFNPGDPASFTIPGAVGGFPATTISIRTVAPFTVEPVTVPVTGEDLPLRWSPAGDTSSVMIVSLRYASAAGATVQDREIYCLLSDDGAFTIEDIQLADWRQSGDVREVVATRLRTDLKQESSAVLHISANHRVRAVVPAP